MKLSAIDIFHYTLPFIKPLSLMGGGLLTERSGFIIRVQNEHKQIAYGEAAPFPNLHAESLDTAKHQLLVLKSELIGQDVPDHLDRLEGGFEQWLGKYNLAPSVRFGIEVALLNLLGKVHNKSLAALLKPDHRTTVSINALVSGKSSTIKEECERFGREGYKAIKLKVGRGALEEDIENVRIARESIDRESSEKTIALRLDANRAWSLEKAIIFGKAVADIPIEYIEEPVADPSQHLTFVRETNIPLALDETLTETSTINALQNLAGIRAFILKPSVLGSLERTMQLAHFAQNHAILSVISSPFHSSIGRTAEANLAACINEHDIPIGLDTYRWFQKDLTSTGFHVEKGQINLKTVNKNSDNITFDLLQKVG
ncbi:MAG: o-succinylbenzoate synthase [bacterium]